MKRILFLWHAWISSMGVSFLLLSCTPSDSPPPSDPYASFLAPPIWRETGPVVQSFKVDLDQPQPIRLDSSWGLVLAPGSFENPDGKTASGIAQIEAIVLDAKADMLFSGLHTLGDSGILESKGMVFLHIHQDSKPLQLKKEASLSLLKFEKGTADPSFTSFYLDKSWKALPDFAEEMIPLPLDLLKLEGIFEGKLSPSQVDKLRSARYAQTFIATPEFEQRISLLALFSSSTTEESGIDPELFTFIQNHSQGSLKDFDQNIVLELKKRPEDDQSWTRLYIAQFLDKPVGSLATPPSPFTWDGTENWQEMVSAGIPEKTASDFIRKRNIRREMIRQRKNAEELSRAQVNIIQSDRLGWLNLDRLAYFDSRGPWLARVKTSPIHPDSVSVQAFLPDKNVIVKLSQSPSGTWEPIIEQDLYPEGLPWFITAIGIKQGQLHFGYTESITHQPRDLMIELKPSTLEEGKALINQLR